MLVGAWRFSGLLRFCDRVAIGGARRGTRSYGRRRPPTCARDRAGQLRPRLAPEAARMNGFRHGSPPPEIPSAAPEPHVGGRDARRRTNRSRRGRLAGVEGIFVRPVR